MSRPDEWPTVLDDFTSRNLERRARLEIVVPALGLPAVQVDDQTFHGTSYDALSGRVCVMMSRPDAVDQHMTHAVTNVRAIDIVAGSDTRAHALLIEHAHGHAMLTFLD